MVEAELCFEEKVCFEEEEVCLMPTVAAGRRFPCLLCPRVSQRVNDNSPLL